MATERIQKILARAGFASRRDAEETIAAGLVTVNGTVATLGDSADPAVDSIKVDGKRIRLPETFRYVLVHKPAGVVSTTEDPEGRPTVVALLPPHLRRGLKPVGRLDFDTEGLIILTDDGDFAQRVAHPRYGSAKTYEVKVKGHPDEEALDRLRRGMVIDGRRTGPIEVSLLKVSRVRKIPGAKRPSSQRPTAPREPNSWWTVVLREGRNRQIREMFFRVGHSVQRLRRIAIGPVKDTTLLRGDWRELEPAEVEALRAKPGAAPPAPAPPRARGAAKRAGGAAGTARATNARSGARSDGSAPPGARPRGGASPARATSRSPHPDDLPKPPRRRSGAGPRPKGPAPKPSPPRKPTAFDTFAPKRPRFEGEGDFEVPRSRPARRPPRPGSGGAGPKPAGAGTGGRGPRKPPTGGRGGGGGRPGGGRPGGGRPSGGGQSGGRPGGGGPGGGRRGAGPGGGRR